MHKRCFALALLVACTGGPHYTVIDAGSDAGLPSPSASCVALPYTCGASGNDNCCTSPEVSGGTYFRSYDLASDANSGDKNSPATVSTFRFDKYEVTVGRFRAFVAANQGTQANPPAVGAGTHPNISGSGWEASWNTNLAADTAALIAGVKCTPDFQTWTDEPGPNENRPMNCVNWYQAMAFCAWDGGYLPTEAEWNYAATGGDQQRAFPWSSPVAGSLAIAGSYASYYDGADCIGDGMSGCALSDLARVGTKPMGDGRWGQSDLAGNVSEWTLDWFASYASPCTNCANLNPASYRVYRGGDYQLRASPYLRTGDRSFQTAQPTSRFRTLGVRCGRAL
jgi:formylglycine-generating enzyme